jgi:diguanylate cyclase (GGDEF)-like protein/PAS domain S-box-containing protein
LKAVGTGKLLIVNKTVFAMKILCVEDNEFSRYLLETVLTAHHHQVVTSQDGEAAWQIVQQQSVDLIISDIMMPRLDGFDLCYRIKSSPAWSATPFIFYSASYTQPSDIRFALRLGADRFLIKPLKPEQLLGEIDAVVANANLNGAAKIQLNEYEFLVGHAKRMGQKLSTMHQRLDHAAEKLQRAQNELSDARRLLGLLVDHSSDAVLVVDTQGRFLSTNASLDKLLKRQTAPNSLADLLPAERYRQLMDLLKTDSQVPHDFHEVMAIGKDRVFITALGVDYQGQKALLLLLRNLQGYTEFATQNLLDQHVLKNLTEAVMITNADNRLIAVNPAFTRITGYSEQEVLGKNPRLFKSGRQNLAFYRRMWSTLLAEGQWQGEVWNRRKNGELFPEWLFLSVVRDDNGSVLFHIGIFNDISAHEEARRHIEHLALHDPLTDTPNRTLLRHRLNDALLMAERNSRLVGLLFLDVDRFKSINDSLGHQAGDEVIKTVSQRLRAAVRQTDTVGRQGGDDFVIVLADLGRRADVECIAEKIMAAIAEPCLIEGQEVLVTCSIGIAMYPDDGTDDVSLIKNADAALYKAKTEGRNNYQFYCAELNHASEQRLEMETALRHAITRHELRLVYQPQYRLDDGRMQGCEVLARWRHPKLGEISPAEFIPLAEDAGLINSIGDWILREACRQAGAWLRAGLPAITFAVNLSAIQFRKPSLSQEVLQILEQTGLDASQLELELTEGILMREAHNTLETLRLFKKMGIELSIDDFGTGYSNLAYLNRFSVDKLKIDQSFVRGLPDNDNDLAIVRAIIQMAHSLGLTVIAEGVESEAQRNLLDAYDCDLAQGYYFAKPLEAHQFEDLLQSELNRSPGRSD